MCRSRCCLTPVTKSLSCVFGERIIQLRNNGEKSEGNSTGCITSSCDDVIYVTFTWCMLGTEIARIRTRRNRTTTI